MQIGKRQGDATYAESIKPIRNRMRRYNYHSLLDAILVYLNAPLLGDKMKDLERLPWVAERLAIWLFADHAREYGTQVAGEIDVRRLIDLAWTAADKGYGGGRPIKQLELFVRQALLPQAPYQKSLDTHAYAIQLHLLAGLPENSKLRIFLNGKAGMPIEDYFEIALLHWAHSTSDKPWFNEQYRSSLADVFPIGQQNTFLRAVSLDVESFQRRCRARTIQLDEWFQPTYFYRTPCVLHGAAVVPFGRPTIRRHFESIVSDWLAEAGRVDLRQDFDRFVEQYVAETLSRAKVSFLGEGQLASFVGAGQVADFLVDDQHGAVLFEVKNKALSQTIPASREPLEVAARLKATVLKAKDQLLRTEQSLRRLQKYSDKPFYRVVVTTTDLWLSCAELLTDDSESTQQRTWLASLEALDQLAEVVQTTGTSMSQIFALFEANQMNGLTASSSLGAFLEDSFNAGRKHPAHLVAHVSKVFEKIESKLTA